MALEDFGNWVKKGEKKNEEDEEERILSLLFPKFRIGRRIINDQRLLQQELQRLHHQTCANISSSSLHNATSISSECIILLQHRICTFHFLPFEFLKFRVYLPPFLIVSYDTA
jgi:hypothetical protein